MTRASQSGSSNYSKLPSIDIPKFSGKYADWPSFKDIFQAVVGKHPGLTDAQRLAHLKSSLTGDAANCIKNIPVVEGNYIRACARLVEHFENTRSLVHSSLTELFQVQPLKLESASGLRTMRDLTMDAFEALDSLGRPVKHWDDLLVYLTVQKLDTVTRRDWETSLGNAREPAKFESLVDFLQTRIRALELSETSSKPVSSSTLNYSKAQGNNTSQSKQAGAVSRLTAHATTQQSTDQTATS